MHKFVKSMSLAYSHRQIYKTDAIFSHELDKLSIKYMRIPRPTGWEVLIIKNLSESQYNALIKAGVKLYPSLAKSELY
jgi:predicted Fe-Mo cluster-binding NifX family protein